MFLTSTHVALLGFVLIATLAGFGQPLLPIQILWLSCSSISHRPVAFEREPAESDAMRRPPGDVGVPLLTWGCSSRMSFAGGVTAVAAVIVMVTHGGGLDHARWLAFNVLVFGQLVRAYANRSLDHPVRVCRGTASCCLPALPWGSFSCSSRLWAHWRPRSAQRLWTP